MFLIRSFGDNILPSIGGQANVLGQCSGFVGERRSPFSPCPASSKITMMLAPVSLSPKECYGTPFVVRLLTLQEVFGSQYTCPRPTMSASHQLSHS